MCLIVWLFEWLLSIWHDICTIYQQLLGLTFKQFEGIAETFATHPCSSPISHRIVLLCLLHTWTATSHFPGAFPSRTLTVKISSHQARTPVWDSRSKNEHPELEYLFFCFSAFLANTSKGHLFLSEASVVRSLTLILDFRNIKKDGSCPEDTAPSRRGAVPTGGTVPRASYSQFSRWSGSVWLRELLLAAQPGAWASSFS